MNAKTPRTVHRVYFYLFFIICVVGLMQSATRISSSRSLTHNAKDMDSERQREAELFYEKDSSRGSRQDQARGITVDEVYRNYTSSPLRDMQQLFAQSPTAKIAPQVLADTADNKSTSVVILLADQADVSAANAIKDQDARGWFVYNTLTQHAARTQVGLQAFLKDQGATYQSFWAANMLVATVDRPLVELLAARPDVALVDSNKPARWIEDPTISKYSPTPSSTNAIEWGVMNVNAPAVWALGFTGTGIVVGDLDTGMRWTHNVLRPKYRGWNGVTADHNYNWHDAIHSGGGSCGANTMAPCDDSGHGTHTAGTMVGDDGAGNQVGVAPGAKWIGCRNMDQGNGTPATYTECFQFMIAPTDLAGNNPNPALRPHVLNNSWTCPVSEGCTTRAELETIVTNTQAAGIFVEASAGNAGPGCSTVSDPPAIYSDSFSTGAINISNVLAGFSSRGPSTYYSPALLKPNLSAPGVNVRSSYVTSDSTYVNLSGTSMAGPHVVGVVALLWSARPQLSRNIATTKTILQNTANPAVTVSPAQTCGGTTSVQIPNNSFGYGRIDALAAVNATPTAAPATISGTITTTDGSPLGGVIMHLKGAAARTTISNSTGNYHFDNLDTYNFYMVTPELVNYHFNPADRSVSLLANMTDAVFTATRDAVMVGNPLDTPEYFVRQQYLDFLGREPDQGGLDFWSGQLHACGADADCRNTRRIGVSAEFFIAREFQDSGLFIYDLYQGALGRRPAYAEYSVDRKKVVGGPGLETEKAAFALSFVERAEFIGQYPLTLTGDMFVDALLQTAQHSSGIDLSSERANLLNLYNSGATASESRSLVLRSVAEGSAFKQAQYNSAFVLMEYFNYLGRNPDQGGYDFWLNVLNNRQPGNYRGMVCSFITSREYQQRFSPVITHSNAECGQ